MVPVGAQSGQDAPQVVLEINKHVQLLERHHRVRIKQWLEKLDLKVALYWHIALKPFAVMVRL